MIMKVVQFPNKQASTKDAFEVLLEPHMESLYRMAYRLTGTHADAEDLIQELFIKLYPKVDEMAQVERLKSWLARVLYNLFVDRKRQKDRSPLQLVEDEQWLEQQVDSAAGPATELQQEQTAQHLETLLETLKPEQRQLILLHDVEGYTLTELESILGTPIGTLKSRLHRTRANLREKLSG
jgi:RNA polymerase sigma-70 factor (ECF subfamily)